MNNTETSLVRPSASSAKAGFSLVEVALALLVVAVGITTAFSLFPEGMRLTRASVNNTEVALFADYVFSTLDMVCQLDAIDKTVWDTSGKVVTAIKRSNTILKSDEGNRMFHKNAINEHTGNFGETLSVLLHADGSGSDKHVFHWVPQWYGYGSGDYRGDYFSKFWTSSFTYTLKFDTFKDQPTRVTLTVWPGSDGTNATPYVFCRSLLNIK
jgi:hypothetical protein